MIRVIGAGPGDVKYLTVEAYEIIRSSPCAAAFGRISRLAGQLGANVIKVDRVEDILDIIGKTKDLDILASGDPCFFGITEYLKRNGIEIDEVIPGLSSFQYMMAKLGKSWEGAHFVSLHGRGGGGLAGAAAGMLVILTDRRNTPMQISAMLHEMGFSGKLYAGFELSYPEEKIVVKNIGEEIENYSDLSVVVAEIAVDQR